MATKEQQDIDQELLEVLKDVVEVQAWQCLGAATNLKNTPIRRLYSEIEAEDVILVYDNVADRFYALDAICSHEGGPLELGDIEDINGSRCIVCPWHSYEFKLSDGFSESSGLELDTYQVLTVEGQVYIRSGETEYSFELPECRKEKTTPESADITPPSQIATNAEEEENSSMSLTKAAYLVLTAGEPQEKIRLSDTYGQDFLSGKISLIGAVELPSEPTRSTSLNIVEPGKEGRRGKGGSLASRIAILHSLANIELWAIDLSWDIVSRFYPNYCFSSGTSLPREFADDFVKIALDETKHFRLLCERLEQLGSYFGELPVHNGLWESAETTHTNLLARLAVVHMVHEARGLDVQPTQITKFTRQNDTESVEILNTVYNEEITHVAAGLKWFSYVCQHTLPEQDPVTEFHSIVKHYFKGYLKPPFNTQARRQAGMSPQWYEPLTRPPKSTLPQSVSKTHLHTSTALRPYQLVKIKESLEPPSSYSSRDQATSKQLLWSHLHLSIRAVCSVSSVLRRSGAPLPFLRRLTSGLIS